MFQKEVVEKIKTQILCLFYYYYFKSCHLWDNMKKYCSAGQATCQQTQRMRIACLVPKATDTLTITVFPLQQ